MLGNVKIYGLLFYHVYSDLMTLVELRKLNKLLDMNVHCFVFLQEVMMHPEWVMDKSIPVFLSESRL